MILCLGGALCTTAPRAPPSHRETGSATAYTTATASATAARIPRPLLAARDRRAFYPRRTQFTPANYLHAAVPVP